MSRPKKPKRDEFTFDLPGIPKRRGRPPSGRALTSAQRQKRYRELLRSLYRSELS